MRKAWSLILICLMFYIAFYLNAVLPDGEMIVHWGETGLPDGYGSKFVALFLIPLVTLGLFMFFSLIPKIAVHKKSIRHFKTHFIGFKLAFVLFMTFVYSIMIMQNLGYPIDFKFLFVFGLASFIFYIGYVLQFTEINYFFGIRTPWTVISPTVWDKTNKLGSVIMRLLAFFIFFSVFLKEFFFISVLVPMITAMAFIYLYSYQEYHREKKSGKLKLVDLKKYTYISIKK